MNVCLSVQLNVTKQRCLVLLGLGYDAQLLAAYAQLCSVGDHIQSPTSIGSDFSTTNGFEKVKEDLRVPFPALVALIHEIERQLKDYMATQELRLQDRVDFATAR